MASKIILTAFLLLFLPFELHCLSAETWIKAAYWYAGSTFPIGDINSALFTHLLFAFAYLNSSTNQLFIYPTYEQHVSTFSHIVKRKNPQIIPLLSMWIRREYSEKNPTMLWVGREYSEKYPTMFFSMITQASRRKTFIASSIKTARLYGFHGLDLCCISPKSNESDMKNLGIFIQEWRAAVKSESRNSTQSQLIITMSAYYYQSTLNPVGYPYPFELMQRNLDWVNLLAYDYYMSARVNFTHAHAALYDPSSKINTNYSIGEMINRGFPASKLVLGLPYHGYAWELVNSSDNGIGAPAVGMAVTSDGSIGYKHIKLIMKNFNYEGSSILYNSTYAVNYYTLGTTWIGFDDEEAIRAKVSYAKEKKLLGYCAWHVAIDDNWVLSLAAAQGEDKDQRNLRHLLVTVLLPIFVPILLLGFMLCYFQRRVLKLKVAGVMDAGKKYLSKVATKMSAVENVDSNAPNLQVFSFAKIKAATNNFSSENKLGEGGFGPVYKGKLLSGQEIAVKRLSKTSNQGLTEFNNEVTLTAKLQHVNLLRVLGFCTEREEKMLIYEYMPNKSLDFYLFDPFRQCQLDWRKRIHIIEGITQGLLYLQEYSNLIIIHRDLKASNILLDNEMNPKISDFGMARIFKKEEHEANTSRIVGTYGYVPPEYVKKGIYSKKLDVYSFGVLLLHIISGKKNTCSYGPNENLTLLDYAHELWKEGRGMDFIDPSLEDSSPSCKLVKCMQIALLCVQEDPMDRPSMLEVSSMLKNETAVIIAPKKPAFSIKRDEDEETMPLLRKRNVSVNDVTISEMVPR